MRLPDSGRYSHPRVRASSLVHWSLDEHRGPAIDLISGLVLDDDTVEGADFLPWVVDSPTGKGRRFDSTVEMGLWQGGAISVAQREALYGDWTAGVFVRLQSLGATSVLLTAAGPSSPDSATNNSLLRISVDPTGEVTTFWENGAGTNVLHTTTGLTLSLYQWTYIVLRKRNTSTASGIPVAGPTGTCDLDVIINGQLVETFSAIGNTSDGATARWRIGSRQNTVGDASLIANADIAGAYLWTDALDIDGIREDVRRLHGRNVYHQVRVRAAIEDQSGVERDITDLDSVDFLDGASFTRTLDTATVSANIELTREQRFQSLATLVTNSKLNLTDVGDMTSYSPFIELGSAVELFSGVVPNGLESEGRDWISVFRGEIDELDEGSRESISLSCRDQGGEILDTWIENEIAYSTPSPLNAPVNMQAILDDNDDTVNGTASLPAKLESYPPTVLYARDTVPWLIKAWEQRKEGVLSALRTVAAQAGGGECTFMYDMNPLDPGWKLTFWIPPRLAPEAYTVLSQEDVLDVNLLRRSILFNRNVVEVVYVSTETVQPTYTSLPAGISANPVTPSWNNIDGEGNPMTAVVKLQSDSSLARLKRRLYMGMTEGTSSQINIITEGQDFALSALLDLSEEDLAKSVPMMLNPTLDLNDIVLFQPTRGLFTAAQKLAIKSITHTFTGDGNTSIEMRGKPAIGPKRWLRQEARAGGAKPAINAVGESLTDMTLGQQLAVNQYLFEKTSQFTGGKYFQIRNPEFSQWSKGLNNEPDGWAGNAGTQGTDWGRSATQLTGSHSLFLAGTNNEVNSDMFPVDGDVDVPYSFEMVWQRFAGTTTGIPTFQVEWFDVDQVFLSSDLLTFPAPLVPNGLGTWYTYRIDGQTPDSGGASRFARIKLGGHGTIAEETLINSVSAYRGKNETNFVKVAGIAAPGTAGFYNIQWDAPPVAGAFDYGNQYNDDTLAPDPDLGFGFLCKVPGRYKVLFSVMGNASSSPKYSSLRVTKNGLYNPNGIANGGASRVALLNGGTVELAPNVNIGYPGVAGSHSALLTLAGSVDLVAGDVLQGEVYLDGAGVSYLGNASTGVTGQVTYMNVALESLA